MEKLTSYEQYAQVLADFKSGKARCATNKMMTREEITALIVAEKLYFEEIDGTLWFFTDEGYFYTSWFYVPKDRPIRMQKQDKAVVAELTGNEERYNEQWDSELVSAGFEKRDKRLEHVLQYADIIEETQKNNKITREFWKRKGFTCRTATKDDYPEIQKLWIDRIGSDRYTVSTLTDAELDEMEKFGRCVVICDRDGRIQAAEAYEKRNNVSFYLWMAAYVLGLGAWIDQEIKIHAYQEGCTKGVGWIRVDNYQSRSLAENHGLGLSGKFFWQFVYPGEDD